MKIYDDKQFIEFQIKSKLAHEKIAKEIQAMTMPQKIEKAAEFATEWILLDGILKGTGSVTKAIANQTKTTIEVVQANKAVETVKSICKGAEDLAIAIDAKGVEIAEKIGNNTRLQAEVSIAEQSKLGEKSVNTISIAKNNISLNGYDPSIGNLQHLEEAMHILKDLPGAVGKNGPITKILENGKIGSNSLATAKGHAFELEVAYDLSEQGLEIEALGQRIVSGSASREFDIVTKSKLIECKNIDWSLLLSDVVKTNYFKDIIGGQAAIARSLGKQFEFYSKQPIPNSFKAWFDKHGIKFYERQ